MKNENRRAPEVLAIILRRIYYSYFNFALTTGYRLEWHELRNLSGLPNITLEYIAAVNKILKNKNLSLSSCVDFLVVDKLDRLQDLRRLTPRVLSENSHNYLYGRHHNYDERGKEIIVIDANTYLKCGDGYFRSWDVSVRDKRWD